MKLEFTNANIFHTFSILSKVLVFPTNFLYARVEYWDTNITKSN